jgi:hypothetical protein
LKHPLLIRLLALATAALAVGCSGVPQTSIYRGFDPAHINAEMTLTVGAAEDLIEQLSLYTRFDRVAGVDKPPPNGVAWNNWTMRFAQHLRVERHEAGVWRLMSRQAAGGWQPWYYQPEKIATFVAAGRWSNGHEPIAVVAYGTDVVFLIKKLWVQRRSRLRRGASMGASHIRRKQADWADLDLSVILKGPQQWRLLLDPEERTLWVLPIKDGALEPARKGWRFALMHPGGVLLRRATRVRFHDEATQPAAAPGGGE